MSAPKRLWPCCGCCDPMQSRYDGCGPHGEPCGIHHDEEGGA